MIQPGIIYMSWWGQGKSSTSSQLPVRESSVWSLLNHVVSGVIGIFLGLLYQRYDTKDLVVILVGLCAAVLCAAAALHGQRVSRTARTLLQRLDVVTTELGRPAEFFPKDLSDDNGHYFREIARYIRQAQPGETIWIMTSHFGGRRAARTQAVHEARRNYHDALEDRARHGVLVKRVFCFNEPVSADSLDARFFSRHTTDHCRRLIEIGVQRPENVSLCVSRSFVGVDFLVIPRRVAAVTADARGDDGQLRDVLCWLFFNPPNGAVIDTLEKWCIGIDNSAEPVRQLPDGAPEEVLPGPQPQRWWAWAAKFFT